MVDVKRRPNGSHVTTWRLPDASLHVHVIPPGRYTDRSVIALKRAIERNHR